MTARLRCAIYTRKSSEEGLEQNFNSLHAQREACEAYVLSQAGEGWVCSSKAYDDGGFSGGNMERPGLKHLLADIGAGLIDIVVVYKVDRLTRSLTDFAKIVERFDARGASFVSVTQAFNTTSSMGRLTLNVLLSFAQFEREVTGERIRDKIAASKAKGLRMGGRPPLGYDIKDGRLAVNEDEAERVRVIFTRYLAASSLTALADEGVLAKLWLCKSGAPRGGGELSRGALNYLLRNPAYLGITCHKDKRYEGTHPAIIDRELWDRVQTKLDATPGVQPKTERRGDQPALKGKLFDDKGHPMVVVHTARSGRRYRYYVSRPKLTGKGEAGSLHRISAGLIEHFLAEQLTPMMASSWTGDGYAPPALCALQRAVLSDDRIIVDLNPAALPPEVIDPIEHTAASACRQVTISFSMRRRQGELMLLRGGGESGASPMLDRALIRAVAMARIWARELEAGAIASAKALARREGLCSHYVGRLLPLAYLAPELTEAILAGRQGAAVTLSAITTRPLPPSWSDQWAMFRNLGMAG